MRGFLARRPDATESAGQPGDQQLCKLSSSAEIFMVATVENVSDTAYGRMIRSLNRIPPARVHDVGNIAFAIRGLRVHQRLAGTSQHLAGVFFI